MSAKFGAKGLSIGTEIWAVETVRRETAQPDFHGFFSSLERAEEFVDGFAYERVRGRWIQLSEDCWIHDRDPEGEECPHRIQRFILDEPPDQYALEA